MLQKYYTTPSLFSILTKARNETTHSAVIAWILDPSADHGLNDLGLRSLLEMVLAVATEGAQPLPAALKSGLAIDIAAGDYSLERVIVQTEVSLVVDSNVRREGRRLDLLVEAEVHHTDGKHPRRLRVIIENKVRAAEGNEQTVAYSRWAADTALEGDLTLMLFLKPTSNAFLLSLAEPECASKAFLQVNYQYLLHYVLSAARDAASDRSRILLEEYIRCLSALPVYESDNESTRKEEIMAIGDTESELLRRFWTENERLFQVIFEAIKTDPGAEVGVPEAIEELQKALQTKDHRWVQLFLDGQPLGTPVQKTLAGWAVVRAILDHGLATPDVASILQKDKSASGCELIASDDQIRFPKRYRLEPEYRIMIDGTTWHPTRNWGVRELRALQRKLLETHFPRLSLDFVEPPARP